MHIRAIKFRFFFDPISIEKKHLTKTASYTPARRAYPYPLRGLLCKMEVNNGGLCRFFVNPSAEIAPYVSKYLGVIGANEHKELYDSFISDNGIDVSDLSSFIIDDVTEFKAQTERYPFNDFDNAFYELKPIQDHLIPYIREHISKF